MTESSANSNSSIPTKGPRSHLPTHITIPLVCLSGAVPFGLLHLFQPKKFEFHAVWALLVFLSYVLVEWRATRLSVGRYNLNFSASELPLVLGAALLSPLFHIPLRFVSTFIGTWIRVRKNPGVPTFGASIGNGAIGSFDVASFTAMLVLLDSSKGITLLNAVVVLLSWSVMYLLNHLAIGLGRWWSGERDFVRKIRNGLTFISCFSLATLATAVLLFANIPGGAKLMVGVLVLSMVVALRPFVKVLVEADSFQVVDEFYELLQSSDSSNLEAALVLASEAIRCKTLHLVIIEREGIDVELDSALVVTSLSRSTLPIAELDPLWLQVLHSSEAHSDNRLIVLPLTVEGRPVGLLVGSDRFETSERAGEQDVSTAGRMARHLSLWLEQDRLLLELRREMESQTTQKLRDPLTGLLNRRGLYDAWTHHVADGENVAVLLIDLDGFKDVNSFIGHDGGDQLLVQAAQSLLAALPPRSFVARIGGDEFAAFVPGVRQPLNPGKDPTGGGELGKHIRRKLARSLTINGESIELAGSIGVAMLPQHGCDLKTLLGHADAALFNAKEDPETGVAVYGDLLYGHETRVIDGYRLKAAIQAKEIEVHFQPVVNMTTFRIAGFEALVRWRDGDRLVPPIEFIGLAEKTGHIHAMTDQVMHVAFNQVMLWRERTGLPLHIGVNLSPLSVTHPDTLPSLSEALKESKMPPADVYLEVTESRMFRDPERATTQLSILRSSGVKVSLDDFGMGSSTHDWLVRMAPDCIKIDRSFVSSMDFDHRALGIIEVDVLLGKKFGMGVIAEGVETYSQFMGLKAAGVNNAQGYLISRPKSARDIDEWLRVEEPELEALLELAGSLESAPRRKR